MRRTWFYRAQIFVTSLRAFALCFLAVGSAVGTAVLAETAKPADAVADAVGVNTHFGFTQSAYYTHSDLVIALMQAMGVRHFRDGLSYLGTNGDYPAQSYAIFNKLGSLGIRGDYVANCGAALSEDEQIMSRLDNVEAVEYPNEYDTGGDSNWVQTLRQCGAKEWPVIRDYNDVQFVGPSLVEMTSPATLGPVPMTANNLHAYFFNYPPDLNYPIGSPMSANAGGGPCTHNKAGGWDCFPGLRFSMDNAQADGPGKPVWITETGYLTNGQPSKSGQGQYVPARYLPAYYVREVLWALNNHVPRVYFYSLVDDNATTGTYGLLNGSLQPKAAYFALSSLIHLMSDSGQWNGAPGDLEFSLTGGDRFLMHSLFEKSDGTFYLVLWLAESDWDGSRDITPAPESVEVSVSGRTILNTDLMQSTGSFLPAPVNQNSMTLPVGTSPVFLEIR